MNSGQILHDPYEPIIIFQVVNKIEYNFELVKKKPPAQLLLISIVF